LVNPIYAWNQEYILDYPIRYLHVRLDNLIYTPGSESTFQIDQFENKFVKIKLVMCKKNDKDNNMKVNKNVVRRKRKQEKNIWRCKNKYSNR